MVDAGSLPLAGEGGWRRTSWSSPLRVHDTRAGKSATLRGLHPVDNLVVLVGCDETTPACLMGACSTNLPDCCVSWSYVERTSSPLSGRHRGKVIGSGTSIWKMNAQRKA
eukprot:scaffold103_cov193-Alexandrium_tamarense.AAC.34